MMYSDCLLIFLLSRAAVAAAMFDLVLGIKCNGIECNLLIMRP